MLGVTVAYSQIDTGTPSLQVAIIEENLADNSSTSKRQMGAVIAVARSVRGTRNSGGGGGRQCSERNSQSCRGRGVNKDITTAPWLMLYLIEVVAFRGVRLSYRVEWSTGRAGPSGDGNGESLSHDNEYLQINCVTTMRLKHLENVVSRDKMSNNNESNETRDKLSDNNGNITIGYLTTMR